MQKPNANLSKTKEVETVQPETGMRLLDASPFVRHVQLLPIRPGDYPQPTRSYDCRLFYVYRGEGQMFLGGCAYPLQRGDLVTWQPGTPYRMEAADGGMQFLCVNFDPTLDYSDRGYPIPPDRLDQFDENSMTARVRFSDAEALNRPVWLRGMQPVEEELLEMKREYLSRRIYWRERLSGLFKSVLGRVARALKSAGAEGGRSEKRVDQLIAYIQEHFDEPLTNEELGKLFSYHPNYLNRQMMLFTGKTLHQYVLSCRIAKAIEYLEATDLPIAEIARRTGFPDMCHFSKLFKQKTGDSPSFYRRSR